MTNLELFKIRYKDNLLNVRQNYPSMYSWPLSQFDSVYDRMINAIIRGSFNKDSIAIKNTCKQLNINHTYKAIKFFIDGGKND